MKGYGQFCPVAKAAEILCERWTLLVLRELVCGSRQFNEIRRGVPLMSPTMLSERLKFLEQAGVVEHRAGARGRRGEYVLTPAGDELRPIIMQFGAWGQRWARQRMTREDLDPGLLVWDMHRHLQTERLPQRRVVIRVELPDAKRGMRDWWLLVESGQVELCLSDPGFEVDLLLRSDVRTLTEVWMGDIGVDRALRSSRLKVLGRTELTRTIGDWLGLNPLAGVERPMHLRQSTAA